MRSLRRALGASRVSPGKKECESFCRASATNKVDGHDAIASIEEDWEADPSQFDFFVVSPGGDFELARTQADVVYVHPDSGAALLVNAKRLAGVEIR